MPSCKIVAALAAAALWPQIPAPRLNAAPPPQASPAPSATPRLRPLPAASKDAASGPAIGARVPAFRLADQSGRPRDLRSLAGRNGLLLAFVRSADW